MLKYDEALNMMLKFVEKFKISKIIVKARNKKKRDKEVGVVQF
jgi:hypothetical protein